MGNKTIPKLPYGAVYFRKSNPPGKDWERDYKTASEDGMNIFRHWFLWGAIEVAPGVYDWEDYDRQMDLAARNGIKTIIAEMITSVPEWAYRKYSHALQVRSDGGKVQSSMGGSCATGGFGGLCLDNEDARELAGGFLKELVLRYKDHDSMLGYDIWNECNYSPNVCYCSRTQQKFREWLKRKYGELKALNTAWHRYSYTEWEDVFAPAALGPYPECMDWLQFKKENFYEQMQWRVDLIRSLDNKNYITAHGLAGSISNMAAGGSDDWLASSKVQIYGFTWVASRKGSEPWKQWHAVDVVRSASKSKPFWHAEAQGGPLWMQPQLTGRPKEDGRISAPEDVRIWNMTSLAGGARGILYPRWRPLLDGPLYGAFGAYGMDGSRTPRSQMAGKIAKWANEKPQEELFKAHPIKGEIGIVVVPETQVFSYLMPNESSHNYYTQAMWGAYRGFFDNNIQADWVLIDDIDQYNTLYLPYPVMLSDKTAGSLIEWVKKGGRLVSEGCPGYFGDNGRVGEIQPNLGLDKLFGAIQDEVEFMPDIAGDIKLDIDGNEVGGGVFLQSYKESGGKIKGHYSDGRTAVIENTYGHGKALLIGTFLSEAYYRTSNPNNRKFFSDILSWAGKEQIVKVADSEVKARIHEGDEGKYIWILNPSLSEIKTDIKVSEELGPISLGRVFWGNFDGVQHGNKFDINIPAKDVLIIKITG